MQVLLVEDEVKISSIYSRIFTANQIPHDVASTGRQALILLEKNEYSLLLVDLMLPGMTGSELMSKMQTLGNYEKAHKVVLTNMGSGYDERLLKELGAQEILLKLSIGPTELTELVHKYRG